MSISSNKLVRLTYDLYVGSEDERELMESATVEQPLEFIYGMGMMLPAFEQQLFGLNAGDTFDFVLSTDDAYGEREEEAVQELPKQIFLNEQGEFDASVVFEGNTLPMYTPDGQTVRGSVLEVRDDVVVMDFNHPLAGESLHFIGKVVSEAEASSEDIEKFFGGQEGCSGGGCSGCGCEGGCH